MDRTDVVDGVTSVSLTKELARFIATTRRDDVPGAIRRQAVHHLTDTVAAAVAGSAEAASRHVVDVLADSGGLGAHAAVPVWGTGHRASLLDACLANGVAAHTLEFDDTVHPGPLHPSGSAAPVAFGLGQLRNVRGCDVVTAYAVGIEVTARLSRVVNPEIYQSGWHSTGPLGAFGAFAAAAQLLGLDEQQITHGLGTTTSLASGMRQNTGTMTKPLHSGNAARSGALAASLASRGFTSREASLDPPLGLVSVFGAAPDALDRLVDWSHEWELQGVESWGLKAYPCCGEATSIIEAAVIALGGESVDAVEAVTVRTGPRAMRILRYPDPHDLEQARFSAQFLCALALIDRDVTLGNLVDDRVDDGEVRHLQRRVDHVEEPADTPLGVYGAAVELRMKDGRTARAEVVDPRGWAHRSLTASELEAKFLDCASGALGGDRARDLFTLMMALDDTDDWSSSWVDGVLRDPRA